MLIQGDELGILDLTTESYLKVLSVVHEIAHRHAGGRLVLTGGGGYDVWNTVKTWFLAIVFLTDPVSSVSIRIISIRNPQEPQSVIMRRRCT